MIGLRATGSTRGESIARSLQRVTLPKKNDLGSLFWHLIIIDVCIVSTRSRRRRRQALIVQR